MKMTEKAVAALAVPAGKRVEHADDDFAGLWLRASAQSKVWYFMGRVRHGRWARVKLGSTRALTVAKARTAAKIAMGRLNGGEDPRIARRDAKAAKLTVRAILADYLDIHVARHKASYRADCCRMINAELSPLADKTISDLDGEQVLKWFRAQASTAVAAKAARVLRALLRHADKRHRVHGRDGRVSTEIIGDMRLWPKPERRHTTLQRPFEWLSALDQVPGSVADLFRCLAHHGLRRDELRTLTWKNVDLQAGAILLPDPKGRRPQFVPMVWQVRKIIERRASEDPHRLSSDAVFSTDDARIIKPEKSRRGLRLQHGRPIGTSTLQRWVGRVSKVTSRWTLHDLRRSYISTAANMGLSTFIVKKLVHHADGSDVTAGYVNLGVEQLRQHAQAVADTLFSPPAQIIAFAHAAE